MSLPELFPNRIVANAIVIPEVQQAIIDVLDRNGFDGLVGLVHYQPMLDNITYELIKKEFEEERK